MVKIEKEKRKRDGLYAKSSCISQVRGKFLSQETLMVLSPGGSWEAGAGVSHIGKLCGSLHPPLSRAPQAFLWSTDRCQLSKWNGSLVSLPGCVLAKIQLDYKAIAPACPRSRKSPSAGWWDLLTVTDSAAPHLLQCVGAHWEQWLFLLVLWMQHSLLPQTGGMMVSWKKNTFKKDKKGGEARCTVASGFLQGMISWQNIFWNSSRHIFPKHYHSCDWNSK